MDHKKNRILKIITVVFFCFCGICALIGMFLKQDEKASSLYQLTEWEANEQQDKADADLSVIPPEAEKVMQETEAVLEEAKEALIYVHVCGAVCKEGVYALPQGSRGVDAVEAAGGFTAKAATAYCNLAEVLVDGMRLYIPTQEEVDSGSVAAVSGQENVSDGTVNINTADKEVLMTLPGIGATKAENIVKYRSRVGSFQTLEELMNVSGIGQAVFEALRDKITL